MRDRKKETVLRERTDKETGETRERMDKAGKLKRLKVS